MLFQVKTMSSHHLAVGNKAMKKPAAWRRTFQADLQIERFTGLLAAGMNLPGAMQRRRYAK
jgi:hypothetical protein